MALLTILAVAALVFALDQASKYLVLQFIQKEASWTLFPALARLFRLTYITNTGAAFGIFPQLGGTFMLVAVMVIVAIILFHHHLPIENFWVRFSLGLQLGGALGNLLDRIRHGHVIDFVDIGFWPIFNLADLSIIAGVTILAYFLWDEEQSSGPTETRPRPPQGRIL
ncbi:MAG: signal peptidase II [Chloroflexota bacterium]